MSVDIHTTMERRRKAFDRWIALRADFSRINDRAPVSESMNRAAQLMAQIDEGLSTTDQAFRAKKIDLADVNQHLDEYGALAAELEKRMHDLECAEHNRNVERIFAERERQVASMQPAEILQRAAKAGFRLALRDGHIVADRPGLSADLVAAIRVHADALRALLHEQGEVIIA